MPSHSLSRGASAGGVEAGGGGGGGVAAKGSVLHAAGGSRGAGGASAAGAWASRGRHRSTHGTDSSGESHPVSPDGGLAAQQPSSSSVGGKGPLKLSVRSQSGAGTGHTSDW